MQGFDLYICYNNKKEMRSMEEITAGHIQDERVQSLTDHLDGTMRLAEGFGAGMGLGAEAGLLGKIHDEGKDTAAFQDYIHGRKHRRVDHSTAGAKSFFENGHIVPFVRQDIMQGSQTWEAGWTVPGHLH